MNFERIELSFYFYDYIFNEVTYGTWPERAPRRYEYTWKYDPDSLNMRYKIVQGNTKNDV